MRTESTISWYNENEGRAYPISEYATRVADNGNILPNDIVADLGVMVPPDDSGTFVSSIRISSIRVTSNIVSIGLSSSRNGLLVGTGILTGTFSVTETRPYVAYPLTPVVDNVSGWVVFGLHKYRNVVEDYRFSTYAQSGLESRVVRIVEALPVRRFLRLAGRNTTYADKIVKLEAGSNIVIEPDLLTNKIIVKLAPGMSEQFYGPCKNKATEAECEVPPIRKINGVCPDETGTITVRFE